MARWREEMHRPAARLAAAICALSLLVCFAQGWRRSGAGMDLPAYVYPAKLWLAGIDPYDIRAYQASYPRFWGPGATTPNSCSFPPQVLIEMVPLALPPWTVALRTWWLVSFGALLTAFWLLTRRFAAWGATETLLLVALLAQSRLVQSVAFRGQMSLFCLGLVLGALALADRRRPMLAGLALALAAAKIILTPPAALYWIWKRQWAPLAWFAAITTVLHAIPILAIGPARFMREYAASARHGLDLEASIVAGSYHVMNWQVLYDTLLGRSTGASAAANLLTLLAAGAATVGVAVAWRRRASRDAEGWVLASVTALTLASTYHRVYDGVFLFVVAFAAWNALRARPGRTPALLALAATLFLFLMVLGAQEVSARVSDRLAATQALASLRPINAWLALLILLQTLWVAWRRASAYSSSNEAPGSSTPPEAAPLPGAAP
ncbi:MAG: DUF2029 domain-containing protein [Chthonomonadales bacterium]|nr:DUF2029 domain-containing protein [Chthonomonadales bacterium]